MLFAAVWLVFLVDALRAAWRSPADTDRAARLGRAGGHGRVRGVYLAVVRLGRAPRAAGCSCASAGRGPWRLLAGLLALLAVMSPAHRARQGTAASCTSPCVGVMCLPSRSAPGLTAVLAVRCRGLGARWSGLVDPAGLTFAVCAAAFAMWGVNQLMPRNVDLLRAREENARLAVADERNRFARDLHDILGHSLTVITVKAELANRLLDVDPERARAELVDLERLSRDALADVRRAVEGYRDLTLPGELARAREALRAADIDADLPNSTDEVPSELRELFAWTVREGVTNVIRHSGASRCTVRLEPDGVEVRDDGAGPRRRAGGPGTGSTGCASGPPRPARCW